MNISMSKVLVPTELKDVKVDDFDADLSEIIFSTPEGENI
jgi:hypothetical protein